MTFECSVCKAKLIECDGTGCGARYCPEHGIQVPSEVCPLKSQDCPARLSIEFRDAFRAPLS